jgi:HTH-type transcriptional regulator/antitoxin HipB
MEYPIKTPHHLGAVLKGFRRDRKLTQAILGAKVGLPQNAVSEIETSPDRSSLARVFKLLAALDLDLVVRARPSSGKRSDW